MADLQTRLSALISAIGSDIKTLRTGLPGTNLQPNSSFERPVTNTAQWPGPALLGTASRFSYDNTQASDGSYSMKIAPLAGDTGNIGYRHENGYAGVIDGQICVFAAEYRRAAGVGNFAFQIEWLDSTQTSISLETAVFLPNTTTGSWQRLTGITNAAPTGARYVRFRIYYTSYTGGTDVMNVDKLQIHVGTICPAYLPKVDEIHGSFITSLPAVTTPASTDEFVVNQANVSARKMTLSQLGVLYASIDDPHLFRDVKAVQAANVSLASATVTVDGVTLVAGERVLLTAQTAPAENGIYTVGTVSAGNAPLTRDTHFNTSLLLANAGVIETTHGTTYGGTAWLTTFKATDTLGTTAMNWYRVTDASYLPLAALLNSSGGPQAFSAGTETYVTGSQIVIPTTRMKVGTVYRCRINISKTSAGTATWSITGRFGTAGTTADTAVVSASVAPAQTAAVDTATVEVEIVFTAVGASGGCKANFTVIHNLAGTGFIGTGSSSFTATGVSGAINTTTAGLKLGVSIAPGASAIYTVNFVETELLNLV